MEIDISTIGKMLVEAHIPDCELLCIHLKSAIERRFQEHKKLTVTAKKTKSQLHGAICDESGTMVAQFVVGTIRGQPYYEILPLQNGQSGSTGTPGAVAR